METYLILVLAGVIIFLGYLGEWVFKKTNIPDAVWLILFGILIGPVLNYGQPEAFESIAPVFTTFALIFILFEGALNIEIKQLFRGMAGGSVLALVNFVASLAVVALIALAFGFGWIQSILLGTVLAGTSSAVVIPMIKRLNIAKRTASALAIESAISDVLCVVGTVTILQVYELGQLQVGNLLHGVLSSFVLALFVGVVAGYLWVLVVNKLAQYAKSYMITIAFMLLLYGFTEWVGSNGAIACLAFGVVLGNSHKIFKLLHKDNNGNKIRASELFFYAEISFLVKSFFFVYLGILLQFTEYLPYVIAGIMVVGLYLVRPGSTLLLRGVTGTDKAMMDSLVPKGLAAAVLATLPAQAGIPGTEMFADVALSVVLITIVTSTILVFLADRELFPGFSYWYAKLYRKVFKR